MTTPYRVIAADPPWAPRDKLPGQTRGAARQYATMPTAELCGFLASLQLQIADDALLALWRLSSMPGDALAVAEAWGFRPVSEVVWQKLTKHGRPWFGMGRTVRASHETALICFRGRASRLVRCRSIRSVFAAPVPVGADGRYIHSAKPEEFYRSVLEPLAAGPYLELFARRSRPGWAAVGDQLPEENR